MLNRYVALFLSAFIVLTAVCGQAADLPAPGIMVLASQPLAEVTLAGVRVRPNEPLVFDFFIDAGSRTAIDSPNFRQESEKLIRYFLTALTFQDTDLWVNLSPYERDRTVPDELGATWLGQDLLAQDYMLKQISASLLYPDREPGVEFWSQLRSKGALTDIPAEVFNKVWVSTERARVLERDGSAFIVDATLKVMLEGDYLAGNEGRGTRDEGRKGSTSNSSFVHSSSSLVEQASQQLLRELLIPALERDVNHGSNFAPLRQMFHAMILATWYKKALKEALLNQVYSDREKTSGVLSDDAAATQKIYERYLEAYRRGVFNVIREDCAGGECAPRKYFSGGVAPNLEIGDHLRVGDRLRSGDCIARGDLAMVTVAVVKSDRAMAREDTGKKHPLKGKRILLVDDDDVFLDLVKARLSKSGAILTTAMSGEQALALLEKQAFDLVLTDLEMPRMNGIELIQTVKKLYPEVRVLIWSGRESNLGRQLTKSKIKFTRDVTKTQNGLLALSKDTEKSIETQLSHLFDKAMTVEPLGGIDLASEEALVVEGSGESASIKIDPRMLRDFEAGDFSGVEGVIVRIVPVRIK